MAAGTVCYLAFRILSVRIVSLGLMPWDCHLMSFSDMTGAWRLWFMMDQPMWIHTLAVLLGVMVVMEVSGDEAWLEENEPMGEPY